MNETIWYRSSQEPVHGFEALLIMYDTLLLAINEDGRKEYVPILQEVFEYITLVGNTLTTNVLHLDNRTNDKAFMYMYFSTNWSRLPDIYNETSGNDKTAWVTCGHTIEIAFLISRAVERGFNKTWLETVQKLYNWFISSAAFNRKNGTIWNYHSDEYGNPLDSGYSEWWQYTEAARAFIHLYQVRNYTDALNYFNLTLQNILTYWWDPKYFGVYSSLNPSTMLPYNSDSYGKGGNWHVGYHETMFYSECIRLCQISNNSTDDSKNSWFLPVIIGVPVVGVLLTCLLFYFLCKKTKQTDSNYRAIL